MFLQFLGKNITVGFYEKKGHHEGLGKRIDSAKPGGCGWYRGKGQSFYVEKVRIYSSKSFGKGNRRLRWRRHQQRMLLLCGLLRQLMDFVNTGLELPIVKLPTTPSINNNFGSSFNDSLPCFPPFLYETVMKNFYLYGGHKHHWITYVYLHFYKRKRRHLEWEWNDSQTFDHWKRNGEKITVIISNEMVPFNMLKLNNENYCIFITQWAKKQSISLNTTAYYYQYFFIHTIRISVQYFFTFVLYL